MVFLPTEQVVQAQEQEDAEQGEESTESRGMRELAQLPYHQQVRVHVCVCVSRTKRAAFSTHTAVCDVLHIPKVALCSNMACIY